MGEQGPKSIPKQSQTKEHQEYAIEPGETLVFVPRAPCIDDYLDAPEEHAGRDNDEDQEYGCFGSHKAYQAERYTHDADEIIEKCALGFASPRGTSKYQERHREPGRFPGHAMKMFSVKGMRRPKMMVTTPRRTSIHQSLE